MAEYVGRFAMNIARCLLGILSRALAFAPSAEESNDRSFPLFLRGEFVFFVVRGYLLVVFTQSLYRATGNLWHNLIYFTSDSVFSLVVPFVIGTWVDRNGPRQLLSLCAVGTAVLLASCAAFCSGGNVLAICILGTCLLASVFSAASRVCVFALIPMLVSASELIRVNGRQQAACQSGTLAGVLSAGLLADRIGLARSLVLMSLTCAAAAWFYFGASRSMKVASQGRHDTDRVRFFELVSTLLRSPMMIALFVVGASDVVTVSLFNLALPVLVAKHFQGASLWLAVIDSLFTFGAMTLGWTTGYVSLKGWQLHPLLVLLPLTMMAWISQLPWFIASLCLLLTFFTGYAVATFSIYFTALMQASIPADLRGRFAALRRMVSTAMVGGGAYCFAVNYAKAGTRGAVATTLAVEMLVLGGCVVWILARKRLRRRVMQPEPDMAQAVMTGDHDDLKPLFERFVERLSRN